MVMRVGFDDVDDLDDSLLLLIYLCDDDTKAHHVFKIFNAFANLSITLY